MKNINSLTKLSDKEAKEIASLETAEERIDSLKKKDPILFYKMAITITLEEMKKLDPSGEELEMLIKKSAGTLNGELYELAKEASKALIKLREAQIKESESTEQTDSLIETLKNRGLGYLFK